MPRRRVVAALAAGLLIVAVAAAVTLALRGGDGERRDAALAGGAGRAPAPADALPIPRSHARAVEPATGVPSGGGDAPSAEQLAAHPPRSRPPTDAELRRELSAYSAYRRTIDPRRFADRLLPAAVLGQIAGWQVSVASVFTDFGLPIACGGGVLHRDQLGVAHKTLPCGTMVTFRYKGRGIRVPVIDRGPYIEGREWDLTGATAVALGFNGLDEIEWKIG